MVVRIRKLAEVVRDNRCSLIAEEFHAAKRERFTLVDEGSFANFPEIAGPGEQFFHDDVPNRSRSRIC